MGDYPPKLVRVAATTFGSLLTLSDRREIPINIRPDRVNQALMAYERPSLYDMLAARSLDVFADTWKTTPDNWQRISAVVRASPVAAAALRQTPSVWEMFVQPASLIREMPQRVYGGLAQGLYTSHQFQFRPDPNRPIPWHRGLLSAPGGRLFDTWVNLESGQVEVESDVLMGHFID